ncbi:hypothetical protein NIES4075_72780 [Tolypothrix sp. NIES-4075]|uniref:hypothetical protein n=1 Tax=Tolypothrix sp. NIES-4075 TaxID=2005459 RepID=UPI000B5CAE1C|nr:hypothetical protein [Tolypothrix sp. NIES-4075]GAX46257.1 hypothetical protein NIES4075_72780 [Tolypothrix sp. NIES-4075]
MAEDTKTQSNNTDNSTQAKRKRLPRKALPSAVQSNTNRSELTIKGRISSAAKAVSASDFPLFRAFILSPDADELFVKTTKNTIISLSTGDRYSSSCSGYLVIL